MAQAIVIFESRKGNTQMMAETIREAMAQAGVEAILKRVAEVNLVELPDFAGVILGSPTYNKDMIGTMKIFLFRLEQVNLRHKIGAAFGAYGWSGEAVGMLTETMKNLYGMDIVEPEIKLAGSAAGVEKSHYQDFGKKIAQKIIARGK